MPEALKRVVLDTTKVLSTRWSSKDLRIPSWAILTVIYITTLRSLAYGLELFLTASENPVTPLMAFVNVLGIETWGILITIGVVVLLIGLLFRSSVTVTFGALFCFAVWTGFALSLGIGSFSIGDGWRFAIQAIATAATWGVFFFLQVKSLAKNGVNT